MSKLFGKCVSFLNLVLTFKLMITPVVTGGAAVYFHHRGVNMTDSYKSELATDLGWVFDAITLVSTMSAARYASSQKKADGNSEAIVTVAKAQNENASILDDNTKDEFKPVKVDIASLPVPPEAKTKGDVT